MGGLIVIGVFFGWLATAIWVARRISRAIGAKASYRPLVTTVLAVLIFLVPVADELAARPSFEALCRKGTVPQIDAQKIKGKTVRLIVNPKNERMKGMLVPVYRSHFEYRDASNGEALGSYDTYFAKGGVFSRAVGFNGSNPVTGSYSCVPLDEGSISERYGFVLLH